MAGMSSLQERELLEKLAKLTWLNDSASGFSWTHHVLGNVEGLYTESLHVVAFVEKKTWLSVFGKILLIGESSPFSSLDQVGHNMPPSWSDTIYIYTQWFSGGLFFTLQ